MERLVEVFAVHDACRRYDFTIGPVDAELFPAVILAPNVVELASYAKIDVAHAHREAVRPEKPAPDELRLGESIEHQARRCIQDARHYDLALAWQRDF